MPFHVLSNAAALLIITLSGCTEPRPSTEQSEALACIYAQYDSLGTDLKQELLRFEAYLLERKFLNDASGESYHAVFRTIAKTGDSPIVLDDFEADSLIESNPWSIGGCIVGDSAPADSSDGAQKLRQLNHAFDSVAHLDGNPFANNAAAIAKTLQPSDFDLELVRIYALYVFYFTALPDYGIELPRNPRECDPTIAIVVDSNSTIFFNDQPVVLESLGQQLELLCAATTDEDDQEQCVLLQVDRSVKMGLLTDIKVILRNANCNRIRYALTE